MRLLNRWVGRLLLMLGCCLAGPPISAARVQAALALPESEALALGGEPQVLVPRGFVAIADVAAGRLDERFATARRPLVALAGDNELWIRLHLRNQLLNIFCPTTILFASRIPFAATRSS